MEIGLSKITEYLSQHFEGCEVIVVDDGSTDSTANDARKILDECQKVQGTVIQLSDNKGKGAAVRQGMLDASGQIKLFLDADNATPIEELKRLLPMVISDDTIVIGSRALDRSKLENRQPWWREQMGRIFNWFMRLVVGLPYLDTQCGFKLFGKKAAQVCFSKQKLNGFAFDVELLWIAKKEGFNVKEVSVRWRHVPQSRVDAIRDSFRMALDAIRVRFLH